MFTLDTVIKKIVTQGSDGISYKPKFLILFKTKTYSDFKEDV